MQISSKKITFAVLVASVLGLSVWFALNQATAQLNQQPPVEIKLMSSLIRARHAVDYEVEVAKNATALVSLDPKIVSHMPRLEQLLAGADNRWQTISDWCEQWSCKETSLKPPIDEFESTTVGSEQALAVLASLPKYGYVDEKVTEDGSTLLRAHYVTIEYSGKHYILSIHTDWKL